MNEGCDGIHNEEGFLVEDPVDSVCGEKVVQALCEMITGGAPEPSDI